MSAEASFPACERFTVLESRKGENVSRCDVCDHLESGHATPGRRSMTGGQIEEIRRRLLIENFEKFEAGRRQRDSNGEKKESEQ